MAACARCGRGLGIADRVRGRELCGPCQAAVAKDAEVAAAQYPSALQAVATGNAPGDSLVPLEEAMKAGQYDWASAKAQFFGRYVEAALADELLTEAEESSLMSAASVLYPDEVELITAFRPYRAQLVIARVNDSRLPELEDPGIVLKRGEVGHLVESAALMKEVVQREFRAGSRGVSFRIAKGVSYRVGAMRGQMVKVGRSIEVADTGTLCVTSQRVAFTGLRKTVEVSYAKLLDINVFTDGIQFHVSNRQNPSMFRVESGPMVAAVVNAAAQRLA